MGVIRVTKFGAEWTGDSINGETPDISNPIMVNPLNKYVAESLSIEDIEIINYIENQSDAFIQTGYSSTKDDITKIIRDIMYFDNRQHRYDGDVLCIGIEKRSDACSIKSNNIIIKTPYEKVKVKYNTFQEITFISNAGTYESSGKFKNAQAEFSIGDIAERVSIPNQEDINYFTNLLLFKSNEEHSNYKARLKTAQIYKNDVLVRDYIAAKRKKDGKVGLFDKVENKFYTSPNGTEFIAG